MDYPESVADDQVDVLHGRTIADPYRWLEDPDSERTRDWVARQNACTEQVFASIPERAWFADLMTRIVSRPRAGTPRKEGGWYFVARNDGTTDQDVHYVAETLDELRAGGRVILDANALSQDGTTSIGGYAVSRDGRYLVYLVSEGGSDWTDFRLLDVATGEPVEDAPIQTKFSGVAWLPDNASYLYESVPHEGRADGSQAGRVVTGLVKRHRVGTPESEDTVVVDVREEYQQGFAWPVVTHDGRYGRRPPQRGHRGGQPAVGLRDRGARRPQ